MRNLENKDISYSNPENISSLHENESDPVIMPALDVDNSQLVPTTCTALDQVWKFNDFLENISNIIEAMELLFE